VRNLPHQLIDAFRSTLEEVNRSDLALHVVDASAPDALSQITTVHGVLHEFGAGDVPELLVLNKTDVAPTPQPATTDDAAGVQSQCLRRRYTKRVPARPSMMMQLAMKPTRWPKPGYGTFWP
jgi:50S ribosomal subunit-associated GTPase HflX